jgi:secreted PhoX family phosphatase
MKTRKSGFAEMRRQLLKTSLIGVVGVATGPLLGGCGSESNSIVVAPPTPDGFGPLGGPDSNGIRLPSGFVSRIVARSGEAPIPGMGFVWHGAPDGGAVFPVDDGGWIYVSNSEMDSALGGVGALRFDASANIIAAYSILSGTTRNCAGGPTPWGTWLSCEEYLGGYVWECDPFGSEPAQRRSALGRFQHEAAAYDPAYGTVYLTEDHPVGLFYRFLPDAFDPLGPPDLVNGRLQAAEIVGGGEGSVIWHDVPDPISVTPPTREQVPQATIFDRGEGLWYHNGMVYMTTTGDHRIWVYDTLVDEISILYDAALVSDPILTGPDNITVSSSGNLYVAEDTAGSQVVFVSPDGSEIQPVVELVGQDDSEITGPAFDPSGTRLYFSSQKGTTGLREDGITYEITGPFI